MDVKPRRGFSRRFDDEPALGRALVTGCAGFIGSHLCERLLDTGYEVSGVDCFTDYYDRETKESNLTAFLHEPGFDFRPLDLSEAELDGLLDGVSTVFHLAGQPGVRLSFGKSFATYLRHNLLATQRLLEEAVRSPVDSFVYASSSSVYGNAPVFPCDELAERLPVSPYGMTKLATEELAAVYHRDFGVPTVGLRYFTVFGPRQRPDMAFHIFCRAALEDRPITIFGDGRQSRDFTFVADVVAATMAAGFVELGEDRIFNVGGGSPASIREVLDLIGEVSGRRLEVHYLEKERGDVRDTEANTTRVREQLGFAPTTTVEQGIVAEFQWVAETFSSGSAGA
jgi:nucleoside-diphosphate-sugar epimerase